MTIYQKLMLEMILFEVGTKPYIVISSDDDKILEKCVSEIKRRIDSIELLYDYPHLFGQYTTPEWLTKILTLEYKSIVLMDFDKKMEERIKNSRYNISNKDKFYLSGNMYDICVFEQMIGYREFLCNASIIVPCSNKLSNAYIEDLSNFSNVYHMDEAEKYITNIFSNTEEIKQRIKSLNKIDYNERYKDRIENHLWPYSGRK